MHAHTTTSSVYVHDLIQARDFTGAVTLLEFNRRSGEEDNLEDTLIWLGYCAFHLGNYQRAIDAYHVSTIYLPHRCS